MKSTIKLILAAGAVCYMAYSAYAENVQISTFYPSPFGDYQNLRVRGTLTSDTAITAATITANSLTTAGLTVNGAATVNGATTVNGTASVTTLRIGTSPVVFDCSSGSCYAAYAP